MAEGLEGACHCGAVRWRMARVPEDATSCNCTICRRYCVLWMYGYEGEDVTLSGPTAVYVWGDRELGFHFCATCGCVAAWRALEADGAGRRRIAVNARLAEPDAVAAIPLRRNDGLVSGKDLPRDGRTVHDLWF
jgi:hypothetical protein